MLCQDHSETGERYPIRSRQSSGVSLLSMSGSAVNAVGCSVIASHRKFRSASAFSGPRRMTVTAPLSLTCCCFVLFQRVSSILSRMFELLPCRLLSLTNSDINAVYHRMYYKRQ
jgi:hypothetical protein